MAGGADPAHRSHHGIEEPVQEEREVLREFQFPLWIPPGRMQSSLGQTRGQTLLEIGDEFPSLQVVLLEDGFDVPGHSQRKTQISTKYNRGIPLYTGAASMPNTIGKMPAPLIWQQRHDALICSDAAVRISVPGQSSREHR